MTHPTLFEVPGVGRARRSDPETSKAAARRTNPSSLRSRIMATLDKGAGLTDRELQLRILPNEPVRWPSLISARGGLVKDSLVVHCGEVRNGRQVWRRADRLPMLVNVRDKAGRL